MTDLQPYLVSLLATAGVLIAIRARALPFLVPRAQRLLNGKQLWRPVILLVDRLLPDWRTRAGIRSHRSARGTESRLAQASQGRPIVLLGGIYLDITVGPVPDLISLSAETSNLHTVTLHAGGSAVHVGRSLKHDHGIRSHLVSRIGADDPLSSALRTLMREERWRASPRRSTRPSPEHQAAVSIHLENSAGTSVLSSPGALRSLTWSKATLGDVQRRTAPGGILLISGYFRTGLHENLCTALGEISPNVLICMDHGDFDPETQGDHVAALRDAFARDLVDVYICSPRELRALAKVLMPLLGQPPQTSDLLELMCAANVLPPVVVVRGSFDVPQTADPRDLRALCSYQGTVDRVHVEDDSLAPAHRGARSEFTAGFLAAVATGGDGWDAWLILNEALASGHASWSARH